MGTLRRRAATAIAFGLLVTGAALAAASLTDPAGDAMGAGADVTRIDASHDSTTWTLRVATPNHSGLQRTENIQVFLDTDRNRSTGTNGYDFRLRVFGGDPTPIALERWSGSWEPAGGLISSSFSAGLTATLSRAALGVSGSVNLAVYTVDGTTGQASDIAPGPSLSERWTYSFTSAPADSDRDGVANPADRCPSIPAGPYDANRNGCPGPFPQIKAHISYLFRLSAGSVYYTQLQVKDVPAASAVVLAGDGVREVRKGAGASRTLIRHRFGAGDLIKLTATKRGWIGYYAEFRVLATGHLTLKRRACTSPTGTAPVACAKVPRGR